METWHEPMFVVIPDVNKNWGQSGGRLAVPKWCHLGAS